MRTAYLIFLTILSLTGPLGRPTSAQLPTNDDPARQIRFDTKSDALAARERMIRFIWEDGLPGATPAVTKNVAIPTLSIGLDPVNIASVDELDADVSKWGFHALSYVLHPKNTVNAQHAVIVHQGHGRNLELGIGSLANHLLRQGFTVVLMNLPLYGWNTDDTATLPGRGPLKFRNHNSMVFDTARNEDGKFFRLFLEPIVQNVNHLTLVPAINKISMIGLSGGGWATQMAAALDSRIKLSIPIAGSCPLYQRNADPMAIGDAEQIYGPMYDENIQPDGSGGGVVTWLEIYVLGAFGNGRRQVQVSNEFDSCCFAGTFADSYKSIVSRKVNQLGAGEWEYVRDSSHRAHQISNHVVATVINPLLGIKEVIAPPDGLPFRDDFDNQTNEIPGSWSVDPDFGSGASAREASGNVAISGKGRAAIVRNLPFNPQSRSPVDMTLEVSELPAHQGVGIFLTDEVGSRPHLLGLRFDASTKEIAIDADGGNQFDAASDRIVLGKVKDYQGGPIKITLRYDVEAFAVDMNFGVAQTFSSGAHPWSEIPGGFKIADLGDRAYLFVHAFDSEDRPVSELCIDSVEVRSDGHGRAFDAAAPTKSVDHRATDVAP